MKKFLQLGLFIFIFCLSVNLSADEIVLNNGNKITGTISRQDAKRVLIDQGLGTNITYYTDEISTINGQPLPQQAAHEASPSKPKVVATENNSVTVTSNSVTVSSNSPQQNNTVVVSPSAVSVSSSSVQLKPTYTSRTTTQTSSSMPSGPGMMIMGLLGMGIGVIILIVLVVLFIFNGLFWGIPGFIIAQKIGTPNPWLAFIPIIGWFYIVSMAQKPWWWGVLMIVPLAGIIVSVIMSMDIAEARNHSKWIGLLVLFPVVNLFLYWFLALVDGNQTIPVTPKTTA